MIEEIVILINIDNVKDDPLILLAVVYSKVEPPAITGIACVGSKTKIVLEFSD